MKINRRTFLKKMNWTLAGIIGLLGFSGCKKESGANYTVRGAVVNKETGTPISGIWVGYRPGSIIGAMYGVIPTPYKPKAYVLTNIKGEFKLTDRFEDNEFQMVDNNRTLPVFVEDVDGKENGLFQTEYLQVDFPKGEHTVTIDVELTEIKDQ